MCHKCHTQTHTDTSCLWLPPPPRTHQHTGKQTHSSRPQTWLLTYNRHVHTGKFLARELKRTTTTKHTDTQVQYWHTRTHRLWVSQHRLAMSGDTGWLITLCTDGHTGEKKGEEESCPLSAQHPSRIFSLLSLYAFIALRPHWSPLTPTPLPLCSMRDLWVAFRDMPSSRGVDMTGINDISSIYSLSWNAQTNPCTQVILLSNQIKGCQPTHQQHAQIKLINLQTQEHCI